MSQDRVLQVCLGEAGIDVGTLWLSGDRSRPYSTFQYAQSWLNDPRRFAISPDLPLSDSRMFFHGSRNSDHLSALPSPLADTVPDSWGQKLLRGTYGLHLTEFDFLVSVDDFSRIGAVRIREISGGPFLAEAPADDRSPVPPILHLDAISRDIQQIERDHPDHDALQRLVDGGSSLGGARPKCSVIQDDGTLSIAKFTSRHDTKPIERAEILALRLARLCGLEVPEARLAQVDGLPIAIIERFDRTASGRVPYLSAQSLMGTASATEGTYVAIAERLREYASRPDESIRQLVSRISFFILISNTDDHLKNHALLYDGGGLWRLSPLFDINPSPERERKLKTAIVDITEPDASIGLLLECSELFEIPADEIRSIVSGQAKTITMRWKEIAKECGMTPQDIQIYSPAFQHEEMQRAIALH